MKSVETFEGETIEKKIERIVHNKEPITDGAPEIFTERKDGVIAAYNIRTDRWEIAAEAMDKVTGALDAKRDGKLGHDDKVAEMIDGGDKKSDSGAKSTQGSPEGGQTGTATK